MHPRTPTTFRPRLPCRDESPSRASWTAPTTSSCWANRPGYHTPLENAYSIADVQATYRLRGQHRADRQLHHYHRRLPPHPIFSTRTRLPTPAELDDALPDHLVFVSYGFAGAAATKSRGRAFLESLLVDDLPAIGDDGAIDRLRRRERQGAATTATPGV